LLHGCHCSSNTSFYTSVMADTLNSSVLLDGIPSLILSARRSAARVVNLLKVYTNYEIGRRIVEQEQRGPLYSGQSFANLALRPSPA
jgi:hypothetical protein